ncbi:MAG: hypothetical protein MUO64_18905 [Anaerolineales bacterium]|nr:hypothetical protein [Anaerolineales bacterium]
MEITIEMALYKHAMEKKLQESEEKHRAVVERANDSIVILQDGIVRFSNPSFSDKIHKNLSGLQIW